MIIPSLLLANQRNKARFPIHNISLCLLASGFVILQKDPLHDLWVISPPANER